MNTSNFDLITSDYFDNFFFQNNFLDFTPNTEGLYIRLDQGWAVSMNSQKAYSWADLVSGINDSTIDSTSTLSFNNVSGSAYQDTIIGNNNSNIINGFGGNDFIGGLGGNDILIGGEGVDKLLGGKGNDTLIGGIEWGETLDGGSGIDAASFDGGTLDGNGVYVRMDQGFVTSKLNHQNFDWWGLVSGIKDGSIKHDTLNSVENIVGSKYSDSINGDSNDNVFHGGAGGNDWFGGGAGNDTLSYAGETEDGTGVYVRMGLGWTWSEGDDRQLTWSEIVQGINENTLAHDKFSKIENVIGSKYHDSIAGDRQDNIIDGREGDDYLFGGDGNDILIGGAGVDALRGERGNDIFYADETDLPINGGQGFDLIAQMDDVDGDNAVNIDLGNSKYNSIEAFIGNSSNDVNYTLNVSLDKVAQQSDGTYDDMFFAIGIDTLTFSEQVEQQSTQELEGDYEAELVALLGLDASTQLKETVYLTENNNLVTVIEEVIEESANDVSGAGSFDFENQEMTYIV
ncbi:calcium-binding protein [Pseudoalteromonas neustonica]|uniref:Calcium-binding protein n=1 Tax=Pseudoalteromonas neustonica TaxID=1840331 RepID=A0ABU9U107_9GAMM